MPPSLSIIIPCYNENATVLAVLKAVAMVAIPYEKEIIIVDDCSLDGTREILQGLESNFAAFMRGDDTAISLSLIHI